MKLIFLSAQMYRTKPNSVQSPVFVISAQGIKLGFIQPAVDAGNISCRHDLIQQDLHEIGNQQLCSRTEKFDKKSPDDEKSIGPDIVLEPEQNNPPFRVKMTKYYI